jgi:hypothetical protein
VNVLFNTGEIDTLDNDCLKYICFFYQLADKLSCPGVGSNLITVEIGIIFQLGHYGTCTVNPEILVIFTNAVSNSEL